MISSHVRGTADRECASEEDGKSALSRGVARRPHFAPPSAVHESFLDVVPAPRVRSNAR